MTYIVFSLGCFGYGFVNVYASFWIFGKEYTIHNKCVNISLWYCACYLIEHKAYFEDYDNVISKKAHMHNHL